MDPKEKENLYHLTKVAKGAGFVFTAMIVSKIISFFYRSIIARGLGPEGYGMIEIGIAVISFVLIFSSLGLAGSAWRYTAYYKGKNDPKRIKGAIQASIIMALPMSITAAIVLFIIAPLLGPFITSHPGIGPEMTMVLQILAFAIPLTVLNAIMRVSMRGLQNIKHMALNEYIIFNVIQLSLAATFLYMGWDVFGIALAYTLSILITTITFFYFLQKKTFPIISKLKAIKPYREILIFGLPLFLAGMATMVMTWTDTLLIGILRDATWSGIYNAALPLAGLIFIIQKSFGSIFSPLMIEMYAQDKKREMAKLYKNVTNWVFYIGFPFLLLLTLFARNAIHFVFGAEYTEGAAALAILSIGFFISSMLSNGNSVLMATKRTKHISINQVAGAGSNIILNLLLIPILGIAGAALATGISLIINNGLSTFQTWRLTGMQPFTSRIARSFIAGLVSISFIFFITELFWEFVPMIWIIVLFFVFFGLYFLLLLALGTLQKSDIQVLSYLENKLGMRNEWLRRIIKKFIRY